MANTIFNEFEVNQSCLIKGMEIDQVNMTVTPKGEMVVNELIQMDINKYTRASKDGRPRRKRKLLPDSIGGFVAQPIFRYKRETRDGEIVYTIWRVQ